MPILVIVRRLSTELHKSGQEPASIVGLSVMEVGAEIELNVDNQEEECDEKKKKKRKLVCSHLKIFLKQNR